MDTKFLGQYYETVVLPLYGDGLDISGITWKDHGRAGQDTWAHYFNDVDGREYVLLYEDFPGSEYMNDELTHELIPCGDEVSLRILASSEKTLDNLLGYFTLYRQK